MINFIKSIIIKLLYSDTVKKVVNPILKNFPFLKSTLSNIRNSIYVVDTKNIKKYKNNFIEEIKKEVELRKIAKTGKQNDHIH